MTNHQRKGTKSNADVGKRFEVAVKTFFADRQLHLVSGVPIEIGVSYRKTHKWDLGCTEQKILIECKAHKWTESGNTPSAKLTTWDQAMYYMYLAPKKYRKIFMCLKDKHPTKERTLAAYYIDTHGHLIPDDVEIWEFCEATQQGEKLAKK